MTSNERRRASWWSGLPLIGLCIVLAGCEANGSVTLTSPTSLAATPSQSSSPTTTLPDPEPTPDPSSTTDASIPATSAQPDPPRLERFSGDGGFVIDGTQLTLVYANGVQATFDIGAPIPTSLPGHVSSTRGQLDIAEDEVRWLGIGNQAYWSVGGAGNLTDAEGSVMVNKDGSSFCYDGRQARWVDSDGSALSSAANGLIALGADGRSMSFGEKVSTTDLVGRYSACNFQATIMIELSGDVLFAFDKDSLTSRGRAILAALAPSLKAQAAGRPVTVTGHTDAKGSETYNDDLGLRRARSVVTELERLAPGLELTPQTMGERMPVAANAKPDGSDNPAGRAKNRRVTIVWAAPRD